MNYNYNKSNDEEVTIIMSIILMILGVIVLFVIAPFISFWLAYFGGWIAEMVIGAKLAAAMNILFNTTYFTAEMLPMMAGALGWIGSFFKSTTTIHNKK